MVIRQSIYTQGNVKTLIQDLHDTLLEGQTHQDLPFEKLVDSLWIERDQSRHHLFQIMFRVQDFTDSTKFEFYNVGKLLKVSQFDFYLLISDKCTQLKGRLTYSTSLFKKETSKRIVKHYINILKQLSEATDKLIKDYQILTAEEYSQIVYKWNATDKDYP